MLKDPKWDQQERQLTDPLTLAAFIAWLEGKPADETYDWMNCEGHCAIDQYGAATGIPRIGAQPSKIISIFGGFENYAVVLGQGPFTFGAALSRARAIARAKSGETG